MAQNYRVHIGVSVNADEAKAGAAQSVAAVASIGKAAETVRPKVDDAANALNTLGSQSGSLAPVTKALTDTGAAAVALRAKYNPLFATLHQYKAAQAEVRAAHVTGALSADEMNAALSRLRQNALATLTSIKGSAGQLSAELATLRARFDPLFAAQQAHIKALNAISIAYDRDAISASTAIDARVRETAAYNAQINTLNGLARARKEAAQVIVNRATVTPDRAGDIEAYGREMNALRAQFNPRYATLTDYRTILSQIRDAHRAGAISAKEMTDAVSRLRGETLATVAAQKGQPSRNPSKLDQFQRQNLMYQVNDTVQSLALGMPISQVLLQQGPQITQIYGGVGNTMKALMGVLTPTRLLLGGVATAALIGATAWNAYLKSTKEVETAASGLGRAVAGTPAQMEAAAQAGAAAAGISVTSARKMETQFLRTGRIGSEHFAELIGLSKNFAATFGMDADAAGQKLGDLFANPARAANELYQQYGLIDAATARQVTNLAAQNRLQEAQGLLIKALPGQLTDAAEATTALARGWKNVVNFASDFFDTLGAGIDDALTDTLDEKIALAQTRFEGLQSSWLVPQSMADNAKAGLDSLKAERLANDVNAAVRKKQAEDIQKSRAAITLAEGSGANATAQREQTLRNEIAALRSARDVSGIDVWGIDATQRGQIDTAIEAKTRALEGLANRQSHLIELDRLDIQIQNERNPVLRAELEARRTGLALADQEVSSQTVANEVSRARTRVIESAIAAARAQAADMQSDVSLRAELAAKVSAGTMTASQANRVLSEELQLRPLIAAAAAAEGDTKKDLTETIANLRTGYAQLAEQQKADANRAALTAQQERLVLLRTETGLVEASEAARSRALAVLTEEHQLRREGIDLASDEARVRREKAAAAADAQTELGQRQAMRSALIAQKERLARPIP